MPQSAIGGEDSMAEERPYEIIDKRKVKLDEETEASDNQTSAQGTKAESPGSTEGQQGQGLSEEERKRLAEILAPDLYKLITGVVQSLADQAWMHMGIVANPATGLIAKDMAKAKLAIDCAQFLADKVSPHLDEEERREIRTLIANLQINFVQRLS
jgi:hypothetical protein